MRKIKFLFLSVLGVSLSGLVLHCDARAESALIQKPGSQVSSKFGRLFPEMQKALKEKSFHKPIRQGIFARQLVRTLNLESQLPLTPTELDCINLLESYGLMPLKGWDRFALLNREDYAVLVGLLLGEEKAVHEKAQDLCDAHVRVIHAQLASHPQQKVNLNAFLEDRALFPTARPHCPYGEPYQLKKKGSGVVFHWHLAKTPLKWVLYEPKDWMQDLFSKKK